MDGGLGGWVDGWTDGWRVGGCCRKLWGSPIRRVHTADPSPSLPCPPLFRALQKSYTPFSRNLYHHMGPSALLSAPVLASGCLLTHRTRAHLFTAERQLQEGGGCLSSLLVSWSLRQCLAHRTCSVKHCEKGKTQERRVERWTGPAPAPRRALPPAPVPALAAAVFPHCCPAAP